MASTPFSNPASPPGAWPGGGIAFFAVDRAGRVAAWSAGAAAAFGYAAAEIVGVSVAVLQTVDRILGSDPDGAARRGAHAGAVEGEESWVRKDGRVFRARHLAAPVRVPDGAPRGVRYVMLPPGGGDWESALFHDNPDPVFAYDPRGCLVDANGAALRLADAEMDALRGTSFLHGVAQADAGRVHEAFRRAADGEPAEVELTAHPHAGPRALRMTYLARTAPPGERTGVFAVAYDGTERHAPADAPHPGAEFYQRMVEGHHGLFFYVLDGDGCLGYLSPSVKSVLGYAPDELVGTPLEALRVADAEAGEGPRPEASRVALQPAPVPMAVRHRDGRTLFLERLETPVREDGRVAGVMGVARDVTQRKLAEDRLLHDALHDPLTGLPNRVLLADRLLHASRVAGRRPEERFAVVALDLDRFKPVNDRLGHDVGDALLVEVARRLTRCVRVGDTVCRLGGDEFVALLDGVAGPDDAARVADRMRAALASPFRVGTHEIVVGASLGLSLSAPGSAQPDELMRHADAALYRAKAAGGSRVEVYDLGMHERARMRTQTEADLRGALERGELVLFYQPVVSLATGEIEEFEALLRWRHPTRGTLAPADFLSVAEDCGAITDIDQWVLAEAVRQLGAWRREQPDAPTRISVNVSARRFVQGDLSLQLRRVVAEEGLSPGALALEVTEEVLSNPAGWGTTLGDDLLGLGVLLQVDNFGTGASSLRDLGRLPVHALKIDRSLVNDVEAHPELMRAAVNLAHGLDLQVVAEGVETAGQLDRMREMACDSAQGFLFCEPVDGAAAGSLLRDGLRANGRPRHADGDRRMA